MKFNLLFLLKNIKFLMTHNLKSEFENKQYQTLMLFEDYCNYEMKENSITDSERLKIMDYDETIETLIECPKSFCRLGDGEINIINGESTSFQKYDPKLAEILLQILETNNKNLYVGINYNYFHSTKILNDVNRRFYLLNAKPYRDFLLTHCTKERKYIAAGFNQLYVISNDLDYDTYYTKLKKLFADRDLIIFAGAGIVEKFEYNLFEQSRNIEVISGPTKDAFDHYEEILSKARTYSKDKTLCFILGPASKALVYQLSNEGYFAWDIGHMAKDYNMYKQHIQRDKDSIFNFYRPD